MRSDSCHAIMWVDSGMKEMKSQKLWKRISYGQMTCEDRMLTCHELTVLEGSRCEAQASRHGF